MARLYILILASVFTFCACGQKHTTVILLPEKTGKPGAVVVTNQAGSLVMDQPYAFTKVKKETAELVQKQTDPKAVSKRYQTVLDAEPAHPVQFILYFETGTTNLTPESRELLPQVFKAAGERAPCEISIIGHTDTVGDADKNSRLSLERAQKTAETLKAFDTGDTAFMIQGFGEKDLLVLTPDETPEARNRRVEIMIR